MSIDDASLIEYIFDILDKNKNGISEFDLIEELKNIPTMSGEIDGIFKDNLSLFTFHFLLFHALYKLRDRGIEQKQFYIEITPLRITLLPYSENTLNVLSEPDPLHKYYMDLNNLHDKTEEDVNDLLTNFWEIFIRNDKRKDALEELGLPSNADEDTIKSKYRRLVMEHHPDRGGDKQRLQAINRAMEVLQVKNR